MLTAALISVLFLGAAPDVQITPYEMANASMAPAIADGDPIFVDRRHQWIRSLQRFDVVVVRDPDRPSHLVVKRVIGLSGESVAVRNGVVFINGRRLAEPYPTQPGDGAFGPLTVPSGQYFFLGDNRAIRDDSRSWQTPTAGDEAVVGKVLWPVTQVRGAGL